MLKILHTADWHLGHVSRGLEDGDAQRLARERLSAVERILGVARRHRVDAVLCAGDLFDSPNPDEAWWRGLLGVFPRMRDWTTPVVLLPGNHDPFIDNCVYSASHPFRRALPGWVHVVDRDDYTFSLGDKGVVVARPCRSRAGDVDLALALPERQPGDTAIRIGLVHGSTFDLEGYQTNFPIARDAATRRGLDYLAIGDTHGFRQVGDGHAPTVYPGAPEATNFGEVDTGFVAVVLFSRHGSTPKVIREPVGRWQWRDIRVTSVRQLEALLVDDLTHAVIRLHLDLTVSLPENDVLERILGELSGTAAAHPRAGAVVIDRERLRIEVAGSEFSSELPETIRATAEELRSRAANDAVATRALRLLHELTRDILRR